jgi:uncharacterized BrkB/YihY/UPF0761 family membrane protein
MRFDPLNRRHVWYLSTKVLCCLLLYSSLGFLLLGMVSFILLIILAGLLFIQDFKLEALHLFGLGFLSFFIVFLIAFLGIVICYLVNPGMKLNSIRCSIFRLGCRK